MGPAEPGPDICGERSKVCPKSESLILDLSYKVPKPVLTLRAPVYPRVVWPALWKGEAAIQNWPDRAGWPPSRPPGATATLAPPLRLTERKTYCVCWRITLKKGSDN